jgi:penicillin-binding protein 1B
MDRQALVLRCREVLSSLRSRFPLRLVGRAALALIGLGFLAITTEALLRARLGTPEGRIPTALYTRPDRGPAVAIATLDGGAMEQRMPVRLEELPDHLIEAVLAIEDQRFHQHHGLDLRRIGGALVANLKAGGIAQGGSTITQQLAKNLFLTARRTPLRKVREAAMALVLEARHGKPEILEAYLNEIYLGHDGGRAIHGIGAAARFYFGKEARRIGLAESALLAGMIHAPNRYAPTRHPRAARERRNLVLEVMADQQRVSRSLADRATRAGLPTRVWPARSVDGRHFRDYIRARVPRRLPRRGAAVHTSLDASMQRIAERAVRHGLDRLRNEAVEAALVAIDPRSGDVLAMVGGRDYGASQFDRAAVARRQPGSAFKPIVALAALERRDGKNPAFTLATYVDDEPLRVRTPSGPWQPANYDRQFRGRVTVREAMEQSLNVPFARIGLAVGPERIVATARRLGITSPLAPVPSLALGSSEVTLMELVRAYGVLAAGGTLAEERTVLSHGAYGRDPEPDQASPAKQVVDPAVAYLVTSTLEGVVARGTGRALNGSGRFESVAGKTGTSNDWRDAWFVAYTPSLVVGAWVGFDDGRSLGTTGAGAALPIVARFLDEIDTGEDRDSFEVPDGITERYIAREDGGWLFECGEREIFLTGTEPSGGNECFPFRLPDWSEVREWGGALTRGAARFLEELLGRERESRRSRSRF